MKLKSSELVTIINFNNYRFASNCSFTIVLINFKTDKNENLIHNRNIRLRT